MYTPAGTRGLCKKSHIVYEQSSTYLYSFARILLWQFKVELLLFRQSSGHFKGANLPMRDKEAEAATACA
jgi:hypothetical protein